MDYSESREAAELAEELLNYIHDGKSIDFIEGYLEPIVEKWHDAHFVEDYKMYKEHVAPELFEED